MNDLINPQVLIAYYNLNGRTKIWDTYLMKTYETDASGWTVRQVQAQIENRLALLKYHDFSGWTSTDDLNTIRFLAMSEHSHTIVFSLSQMSLAVKSPDDEESFILTPAK